MIKKENKEKEEIKLFEKRMLFYILTSRFNNYYWNINKNYRIKNNIKCIYGSPITISKKIAYKKECIVLEMNNDINKIIGIGLIENYPYLNKHKIYNNKYDRYIYTSNKWIDVLKLLSICKENIDNNYEKEEINIKNKEIIIMIEVLEQLCFYGNEHLKRGNGLKIFPIKYLYRLEKELNIIKILKDLFNI